MREHLMAGARDPLVPQRRNIDRGDDNPLSGTRRGVSEQPPVEIDDLTAARP
jgi:hypothetical protein